MLFDREDDDFGSDVATRALSVTAVETDFVARVYEKQASWYDLWFGPTLHHGRLVAIERMGVKPDDRILEVGVGTGINTALYSRDCHVIGIDFSSLMLDKARERVRPATLPSDEYVVIGRSYHAASSPSGSFMIRDTLAASLGSASRSES